VAAFSDGIWQRVLSGYLSLPISIAAPVVTIGDRDHFAPQGGMIGFIMESNKVRFEINLEAAGRAQAEIQFTAADAGEDGSHNWQSRRGLVREHGDPHW
jgi:hypothetical protein